MQAIVHESATEFLAACRETLEAQEVANALILGLASRLAAENTEPRTDALVARIVGDPEYEKLWLARCRRMHMELERRTIS
jgi:hypothetical protein